MKETPSAHLLDHKTSGDRDTIDGAYAIPRSDSYYLQVIASCGGGWDHVSVTRRAKNLDGFATPDWDDMEYVRKLFFRGDEWAVQFGCPAAKHINRHPHVLHWWRPQVGTLPTPETWMV